MGRGSPTMSRLTPAGVLGILAAAWLLGGLRDFLFVGIAVAVAELAWLRFGLVDLRRRPWRKPRTAPSPDALQHSFDALRDELVTAAHSSREFDRKLRTRLSRVLALQLQERRGVSLDRSPERARALVSSQVWDLLDPSRPNVVDREQPGVSLARVRRVVDELEAL
jgi:hypothetical protein